MQPVPGQPAQLPAVSLRLGAGYQFAVDFGLPGVSQLGTDATPPLGQGAGPDSEMLLMGAVANCLCGSLAFALRKFKNEEFGLEAKATCSLARNDAGKLRMDGIHVEVQIDAVASSLRLLERALAQFEDFCVVTQSVRAAIPVTVLVRDRQGTKLWPH